MPDSSRKKEYNEKQKDHDSTKGTHRKGAKVMLRFIKRMSALSLMLCLLATAFAGCNAPTGSIKKNALCIAITGQAFSEDFLAKFNPLYAQNDQEYAAGALVAPSIMRYEEGKGWVSVLGTISAKTEGGKTVNFRGDSDLIGSFCQVIITKAKSWSLDGKIKE